MNICFARVDDRLLHGQLTATWVRKLAITTIFVVDDAYARDKMASKVLAMMAPQKIRISVLSVEQAAYMLDVGCPELNSENIMVLFRDLKTAFRLIEQAGEAFTTLNLGGMSCRIGRQELSKNLCLSNEEREIIQCLDEKYHINVYSQVLPGDQPVDVGTELLRDDTRR